MNDDMAKNYVGDDARLTKFLCKTFREYTICFIGYSMNDVLFEYLLRTLKGIKLNLYSFFSYASDGEKEDKQSKCKPLRITPIFYHKNSGYDILSETLFEWAELYEKGIQGKELIISQYASRNPNESTPNDNFVSRVLYALTDGRLILLKNKVCEFSIS
ncbi:MAG: SIR2 family protein [Chlamydiales bacterium]